MLLVGGVGIVGAAPGRPALLPHPARLAGSKRGFSSALDIAKLTGGGRGLRLQILQRRPRLQILQRLLALRALSAGAVWSC